MDKYGREEHHKIIQKSCCTSEGADEAISTIERELINMTEQEEDIICRMHKLVGDKWALIAGRVPGKTPQEIERFWLMKNNNNFKGKRIMEIKKRDTN